MVIPNQQASSDEVDEVELSVEENRSYLRGRSVCLLMEAEKASV